MVKLICMSFDGDFVTEGEFNSIADAWEHSEDIGSRWYFYPFHFVTTESGKTIKAAPELLGRFEGVRTKQVVARFAEVAKTPEAQNADVEAFTFMV